MFYSLFQLPNKKTLRKEIFDEIIKNHKSIHFACENLSIKDLKDIMIIENMWEVKQTLPYCIDKIDSQ